MLNRFATTSSPISKWGIAIAAGVRELPAARALADHFEELLGRTIVPPAHTPAGVYRREALPQ
ncbi:MAG TPA: hypothetical protein VGM27_21595 [Acidobacteriaceae bacterium]